jgi:uncharacterized membrane protein
MMTLHDVNALRSAGLLSAAQYFAASRQVRDAAAWRQWSRRALLAFGAGHLLAGIVFFFAYNWADLPDVAKFAIVESGVVATAVASLILGVDRPHGQVALIGASVLTGVLLAVIGQVYQTGADAYQLFVAWTLLILPWTLAARSPALWLLWLVVGGTAFCLYGAQVLVPERILTGTEVGLGLGLIAVVALIIRELMAHAGYSWLGPRWTRLVAAFAALALLFWPAAAVVFDSGGSGFELVGFVTAVAAGGYIYGRRLPDYAAATFVVGFAALFLIAVGLRAINETVGFEWDEARPMIVGTGITILWSVLVFGTAAKLMQRMRGSMQRVGQ